MYLHESMHQTHTMGHILKIMIFKAVTSDTTVLLSYIYNEMHPRGRSQTHAQIAPVTFQWLEFVMFVQKWQFSGENVALIFYLHNQQMSQRECQSKGTKGLARRKEIHKKGKRGILSHSLFCLGCWCATRMKDFSQCLEDQIPTVGCKARGSSRERG